MFQCWFADEKRVHIYTSPSECLCVYYTFMYIHLLRYGCMGHSRIDQSTRIASKLSLGPTLWPVVGSWLVTCRSLLTQGMDALQGYFRFAAALHR